MSVSLEHVSNFVGRHLLQRLLSRFAALLLLLLLSVCGLCCNRLHDRLARLQRSQPLAQRLFTLEKDEHTKNNTTTTRYLLFLLIL